MHLLQDLKLQSCPDVTWSQSGACSDFSKSTVVLIWCESDIPHSLCLNLSWLRKKSELVENIIGHWINQIDKLNIPFVLMWSGWEVSWIWPSRFFGVLLWDACNYKYFWFTRYDNRGCVYWSWVVYLLLLILPSWCGAGWSVVYWWNLWVERGRHDRSWYMKISCSFDPSRSDEY
jgi:hypothetical protein